MQMDSDSDNEDSKTSKPKKKTAAKAKTKNPPASAKNASSSIRNCSIITEGEVLKTVAGDIYGWKPCKENLPNHPTMAFFGKRRTGKSTTITNIAQKCCQDIPFGIVVS